MAAVTQVIPNFLGGVSKQTDHKKLPGQVRECLNAYPDPTFGLMKRPGFKFIKTLHESSNPNSPDFADAKWFFIKRDNQETYIGNISGPSINIWNKDGVPATVSYPNGTGYLDTTRDNYDILTVQDTSIITNKTKEIGTKAAPTDHIPDSHATIRLLQTAYSSKYDVNIQIGSSAVFQAATYTTINAENLSDPTITPVPHEEKYNTTDRILGELESQLITWSNSLAGAVHTMDPLTGAVNFTDRIPGTYDFTALTGSSSGSGFECTVEVAEDTTATVVMTDGGVNFIAGETITIPGSLIGGGDTSGGGTGDIIITVATIGSPGSFTINKLEATIELEFKKAGVLKPFTLTVADNQGGNNIMAFGEQVSSVAMLPAKSLQGRKVKVINSGAKEDAYWSEFIANDFISGKGYWEETIDPTISTGMDPLTLPHELRWVSTGIFVFQSAPWIDRNVGDATTNKHPSFVGTKIQQTFFHNNRLGILNEDNVAMSKSDDFYNFYFTSALTTTDADPIDINCSSIRPAVLHAVLPTAQGLILFSRNQQFILFSDAEILTPASAVIRGISNYEMDPNIDPVDVGTVLNFVSKTPSYTRVFGMQTRGSEESPHVMDIGKIVSEWVPDTVTNLLASPQNSLIALYGTLDKSMYIYKTYIVGEKVLMQSWFKWDLPGNVQFASVDSDTMWSVVEKSGVYHLISASLTQTPEETIMTTSDGQQINPHMDMYTVADNNKIQGVLLTITHTGTVDGARAQGEYDIGPGDYTTNGSGTGASFQVSVAANGSPTVTLVEGGSGYTLDTDLITLDPSKTGGGATIQVFPASITNNRKVVYDATDDVSKCYIPYADLTTLNPVILVAGNATQDFAGVTEFGFTVSPSRSEEIGTDTDGTYFKVAGKDLSGSAANVYVGYQYNYDIELPKTYYKLNPDGTQYDYTAALTVARMKFAVGLSSVVGFKVKSKGYRGPLAEFTGDGATGSFVLPFLLKEENGIRITLDGAKQPASAYSVARTVENGVIIDNSDTVTFTTTAPRGHTIKQLYGASGYEGHDNLNGGVVVGSLSVPTLTNSIEGTGMTVNTLVDSVSGVVTDAFVADQGSGYKPNDVLTITGGHINAFTWDNGTGSTQYNWNGPGSGAGNNPYTIVGDCVAAGLAGNACNQYTTTSVNGTGAEFLVTIGAGTGIIQSIDIVKRGRGYVVGDTITISGYDLGWNKYSGAGGGGTEPNDVVLTVTALNEDSTFLIDELPQAIAITTDTWYDVQPVQDAGQYLSDDVPLIEENIFTVPIHQRSDNFNLRVFSNSPFPVSLSSLMWEGQYSPRFYRRT